MGCGHPDRQMAALDTDRREDVKLEAEEFACGNDALSGWESEWDDLNELERLPSPMSTFHALSDAPLLRHGPSSAQDDQRRIRMQPRS